MPRPLKCRRQNVIISDHAWNDRWMERAGLKLSKKHVRRIIQAKLTNDARSDGIYLDDTGATWVEVTTWLWAVARHDRKGWVVATFTVWDGSSKRKAVG